VVDCIAFVVDDVNEDDKVLTSVDVKFAVVMPFVAIEPAVALFVEATDATTAKIKVIK
jgi:hypothetical protein